MWSIYSQWRSFSESNPVPCTNSFRKKQLSILTSCMANVSKVHVVFSLSTLICLNKDTFEGHLYHTVNNFVKQNKSSLWERKLNAWIDLTGFAIDPLVTSQSGVWCKWTDVSHLVVMLHSMYRCRLVRQTPYACSPAIDGSVLTVVVRECIVVFGWVSAPRPILGVDASSVVSLELNSWIYRMCVQILVAFHPVWAKSSKNCWVMSGVESLLHGSWSWLLNCDVMTDVVLIQTVYKVLRRNHIWVVIDSQPSSKPHSALSVSP